MKNKGVNIVLLLLLVIFISFRISTACSELEKMNLSEPPIAELPKTYTGTLPCADCPGIWYYFQIGEDSFIELMQYRDRSLDFSETIGTWELWGDTLFAYRDDELYQAFLYEEDELLLLDQQKETVTGELAGSYRLERIMSEKSIRSRYAELKEKGIDFIASGNEPFWSIQLDAGNTLIYRTPEDSIQIQAPDIQSSEEEISFSTGGAHSIEMQAVKKYCIDTMSGFLFTHTVTARVDGRSLTGCGLFLD